VLQRWSAQQALMQVQVQVQVRAREIFCGKTEHGSFLKSLSFYEIGECASEVLPRGWMGACHGAIESVHMCEMGKRISRMCKDRPKAAM